LEGFHQSRSGALVVLWSVCALVAVACTFDLADVEPEADGQPVDGGAESGANGGTGGAGGAGGADGSTGGTAGLDASWPEPDASESGPEVGPEDTGADSNAGGAGGAGGTDGGPPTTNTIRPSNALDGDGFLANPALCGQQVWDFYEQSTYKALHVGRDVPCSEVATYRTYMRFELQSLVGTTIQSAVLRFELRSKSDPTAGVDLLEIADFGNLGAGDWSGGEKHDFGEVFNTTTALGWVGTDVTARVAAAVSDGQIAFKLQYRDESADPQGKSRWYGITSANEGSSRAPQLVVTYLPAL
jgi:hypothetical protein